jgi:transcriptional regulator
MPLPSPPEDHAQGGSTVLVHPWDSAEDEEWRAWLAAHDFGQLIAGGRDRDLPVVVPTHFVFDGERTVWLHLARPNPVWEPLTEHPRALLTVIGDYTYIPSAWNANPGSPAGHGVPTSYYATVQLACDVRIVDDPAEKTAILDRQLGRFEPGSGRLPVSATEDPDRRHLPGIRGIELTVTGVRAKFKYGGNKTADHVREIAGRLEERGGPDDIAARAHALRRA